MKKSKVIKNLIRKYSLKHGDFVDMNILKFIAGKEKIEIRDLMTIFNISVSNRSRLRKSPLNKARIKIFDEEELKEIEVEVKNEVKELQRITSNHLDRLCKKYKINRCIIKKILKISDNQNYKLKKGQKFIILKSRDEEKEIMNDLFMEEVKYKDVINKEQIENLKQKYKLDDEEICALLKIKTINYKNLIQGITKNMKIDLLDEYEKREIEQKLIEKFRNQDYITKEDIIKLKMDIHATDKIIKDILSIPSEAFYAIMKGKIIKTKITLKEIKFKMYCLKMDIKYEYGEGFYTNSEIRKLCKKYQIDLDAFLKNLSTNVNRYPYIKQALKYNEKGIYIGEEHQLSGEFADKYAKRIENMCKKITNRYCYTSYLYTEKLDIAQEAFMMILQKGGNIEKNFCYDENLLFNMFATKIKYFVIGKRNKRCREILLDSFENYAYNDDEYDIYDERNEPVCSSMDSRIKVIHQHVMQIFKDNKEYIHHYRKKAYKIIAYKLKIPIEKLKNIIENIKEIYLEYGFAKKCTDGSIIDMSDSDYFYGI